MDKLTDILKKNFKVASFDMDGTLIQGTTSNLFFAKLLGVEKEVIDLEYKLKIGEIDSSTFMVVISEIMDKLTVEYIKNNFHLLPIIDGIKQTLQYLRSANIVPILVTTSNILFADCFKERFGFEHVFGTVHEIMSCGRIGIGKKVCSSNHKIKHVQELVESLGGTMSEVIAIGDSFSDLPLFQKVGCSIAFNYDETLEGKADIYIKSNNIFSVLSGIEKNMNTNRGNEILIKDNSF